MMKFGKGFLAGAVLVTGVVLAGAYAFKKKVVDPVEAKEKRIMDSRKKAARKRIAR